MRQHGKVSEVTEKKTAVYVDDQQRILIRQLARGWLWRSELPTWLLIVTVYGGWFACVAGWRTLGLFPATLLLIWFTAWYMSLQHELIHGHPTRLAWFNQLLVTLPLAVWYPYGVYRDSHLAHHRNHLLTHPEDDPESYYVTAESWQRFSAWQRRLIHLRNTFWGRLLLAPMMDILHTLNSALRAFREGDRRAIAMWSLHLLLLTGLLTWMAAQGFSPLWFVLAVSYPALALTKVRSFLEHRAADDPLARSVINEAGPPGGRCSSISTTMRCIMICQGSPGTLYVNCICIARRRICSVIRGSWCAGTASGDAILAAGRWR